MIQTHLDGLSYDGSNFNGVAVQMDGIKSPGAFSEEASSLSQNKTENSTPMLSVSTPTHDTIRAKYQMKELETFAKRLEEVSNNLYCSKLFKALYFCVQL